MTQLFKRALGGALGLGGLVALFLPTLRAEVYYEGGFVYRTPSGGRASGFAPRHDHHPPMQFHSTSSAAVGGASGYRFYSPRSSASGVAPSSPSPVSAAVPRPDYGVPAADQPWNRVSFVAYDEPAAAPPNAPVGRAVKYSLEASALPHRVPAEHGSVVVLMAHLPEDAALWVEGVLTSARGQTRYFESPPLSPGKTYRYAVQATWRENGRWVSQTREVLIRAGEVHGIYLTASTAKQFSAAK